MLAEQFGSTTDAWAFAQENLTTLPDNKPGEYYTAAVNWAVEYGVVTGYTDEAGVGYAFDPDGDVTREQLCTMLYRYAGAEGAVEQMAVQAESTERQTGDGSTTLVPAALATSSDLSKWSAKVKELDLVSTWARKGVAWALENGVIEGKLNDDGSRSMAPGDPTWRASMAKMCVRLYRDALGDETEYALPEVPDYLDVQVEAGCRAVSATWSAHKDAECYGVWVRPQGGMFRCVQIGDMDDAFTITRLVENTPYDVLVRVKENGWWSPVPQQGALPQCTPYFKSSERASCTVSAASCDQMILVEATGTRATVSLHEKDAAGIWSERLSTAGYVGAWGVGQTRDGVPITPAGSFDIPFAFGNAPNPGSALPWHDTTEESTWVDDPDSGCYNTWQEWSGYSGEHLEAIGPLYDYALVIGYNYPRYCDWQDSRVVLDGGAAFFMHISADEPTFGCVSVPRDMMIKFVQQVRPGCRIVIGTADSVYDY